MMKEEWTEQLRRKLEGHQMTPPEGLWEDICKEMGFEVEPVHKQRATRRRYWAAAAAVLALVGFFASYHAIESEHPLQAEVTTQKPVLNQGNGVDCRDMSLRDVNHEDESMILDRIKRPVPVIHQEAEPLVSDSVMIPATSSPDKVIAINSPSNETDINSPSNETATSSLSNETATVSSKSPAIISSARPESPVVRSREEHSGKWSVGVNASGGLLASANTKGRYDYIGQQNTNSYFHLTDGPAYVDDLSKNLVGYYQPATMNENNRPSILDYKWKHHLPVRFGVTLQYQLNDRLALLSGVNYTRLYSQFSMPFYQEETYDQHLNYIGVPIGVAWQLWSTSRLNVYLSGETVVEKCVHSNAKDWDGNVKRPWQLSVNVSAGAEYTLMRQLGLYLEPSLGYYFGDGTSLEHYYKEHPIAPTVEFGLRLHLNQ